MATCELENLTLFHSAANAKREEADFGWGLAQIDVRSDLGAQIAVGSAKAYQTKDIAVT